MIQLNQLILIIKLILLDFVGQHTVSDHKMTLHVDFLQLNEDLEGHIDFLAQTGPFSVPIRCVTKKCQVNHQCIDAVAVATVGNMFYYI